MRSKTHNKYQIHAYSTRGKCLYTLIREDLSTLIDLFNYNHPHFEGEGVLQEGVLLSDEIEPGVWISSREKWETIHTFQSTQEFKTYQGEGQ